MVISQPPGNNPSYYYRASPTFINCSMNASRDTLCSIHAITTSGVTHRNGAIKHIFYTNQIYGGIISRLFFIHCHSSIFPFRLKYYFVFLYEDLSTLLPYHQFCPLRMPTGPHFVTQPILLSENIPNIWHKSSTKHRRSDQIETIKTIIQTTRPRIITWKVLPMAQVAIFKKYSIKCEKI